jgi:hypothetical protein
LGLSHDSPDLWTFYPCDHVPQLSVIEQVAFRLFALAPSKEIVAFSDRSELLPEIFRIQEVNDIVAIAFYMEIERMQVRHLHECHVLIDRYFCHVYFPSLEHGWCIHLCSP